MIIKLRRILSKIRYFFSNQSCYDEMVKRGYAKDESCGGVVGGTAATGYLSESCCDCEYLDIKIWKENNNG